MTIRKPLAVGALIGGSAALTIVGITAFSGPQTVSGNAVLGGGEPKLSALATEQVAPAALPDSILKLPVAERFLDASQARKVATNDGLTYYLVPGVDRTVCLIYVGTDFGIEDPVSAGTCAPLADALTNGVYFIEQSGEKSTVAVVAPDGITAVTAGDVTADVTNNVAIIETSDPSTLRFTNGTARMSATVSTGAQEPTKAIPSE